jgi:hypothetical protein
VTDCQQVGIAYDTLGGRRTVTFKLRFEATSRTPDGAPVSADRLQEKTHRLVVDTLGKFAEELPIIMTGPPVLGSLESLTAEVVSPIVARLVASWLRGEFDAVDEGERVTVHVCGTM